MIGGGQPDAATTPGSAFSKSRARRTSSCCVSRPSQRLKAGFREHGERGAPVGRIGFAAHETAFLETDDDTGNSARCEHPLRAEVAHPQSQFRSGDERDQDAIVGERQFALLTEAVVDLAHHRFAQTDQCAPGVELLGSEGIWLRQLLEPESRIVVFI
jgi:hypothetical protein